MPADDKHELTGLTDGKLGMFLFLAAESMLFAALFASYVVLRGGVNDWPKSVTHLDLRWAAVAAGVLLISGGLFRDAIARTSRARLMGALALVLFFLALLAREYWRLRAGGNGPSTHNFFAIFFVLTGVHASYLASALVSSAILMRRANWSALRTLEVYWQVNVAIGLFLFLFIYIL